MIASEHFEADRDHRASLCLFISSQQPKHCDHITQVSNFGHVACIR